MQSPFYNVAFPDYLNYGGIGAIIGHELTVSSNKSIKTLLHPLTFITIISTRLIVLAENMMVTVTWLIGGPTIHLQSLRKRQSASLISIPNLMSVSPITKQQT